MSGKRDAVNFKKIINQMTDDALEKKEWPTVVGGECSEAELVDWLDGLDLSGMPTRIWSYTDHCTFGDEGPPATAKRLERARLFGPGGDLDVRRDGERFRWRYVGEADYAPDGDRLSYPGTPERPVYCRTRKALLWGTREKEQARWFDDRVAGAGLTYFAETPALPDGVEERVKVECREYTQAGRTIAVWLRGLNRYKKEKKNE